MTYLKIFQGTVYPQAFHAPISTDIERLVQRYNTLQPRQFQSPQGNLVAVSGYLTINVNNAPVNITLDITLTPRFPQEAPYILLRIPPQQIRPSPAVQPNGVVNLQVIHQWVFRQSTLVKLGDDLYRYLCQNPPINVAPQGYPPQYAQPGYPPQQQQRYPPQQPQSGYPPQQQGYAPNPAQPMMFAAPNAMTNSADSFDMQFDQAQKGFQDNIYSLKSKYSSGEMTLDELIEKVQQTSRNYFKTTVADRLRSYPQAM